MTCTRLLCLQRKSVKRLVGTKVFQCLDHFLSGTSYTGCRGTAGLSSILVLELQHVTLNVYTLYSHGIDHVVQLLKLVPL